MLLLFFSFFNLSIFTTNSFGSVYSCITLVEDKIIKRCSFSYFSCCPFLQSAALTHNHNSVTHDLKLQTVSEHGSDRAVCGRDQDQADLEAEPIFF